jgi:hypothetical protein
MDEELYFYQVVEMNNLIADIRTDLEFALSDIEDLLENFEHSEKITSLLECIDYAKNDAEKLKIKYDSYKMSFCPCCHKKKEKK